MSKSPTESQHAHEEGKVSPDFCPIFTLQMLEESLPRSKAQGSGHLAFSLGGTSESGQHGEPGGGTVRPWCSESSLE